VLTAKMRVLFKAKVAIAISTWVSIGATELTQKTEYNTINLF
jgi:hypothetical protein